MLGLAKGGPFLGLAARGLREPTNQCGMAIFEIRPDPENGVDTWKKWCTACQSNLDEEHAASFFHQHKMRELAIMRGKPGIDGNERVMSWLYGWWMADSVARVL